MAAETFGLVTGVALVSALCVAAGGEAPPAPATLEVRQRDFGHWRITQILQSDGPFVDPATFYAGIGLSEVRQACPPGLDGRIAEDGQLVFSMQMFLVQKDGENVLIEMGSGNDKERPQEPWMHRQKLPLLETLEKLGVKPEDVQYVFLTHLHEDHVGFSTTLRDGRWVPTFPKARYVVSRVEWDYFAGLPKEKHHPSIDDSVLPLAEAGVVDFVRPGDERAGFRIHGSPAHTPGGLLFELPDVNVWFVGDLFHHPAQIARPEWKSATFDFNPGLVEVERRKYFGYFADSGAVVYAEHTGHPYRVLRDAGGGFAGRISR
jgi:glyoxylase-like metal-dependent hydrolase (beta-lactamase superfamily II)